MNISINHYTPTKDEENFINSYDPDKYQKPSVTVDVIVFTAGYNKNTNIRKVPEYVPRVLLIRRKNYPYKDYFALPGGFVDMDEDLDEAALRELREETGVSQIYIEQLYTFGGVKRDPRYRTISCAYMSLVKEDSIIIKAGDDAKEACLFDISAVIVNEKKYTKDSSVVNEREWELILSNEACCLKSRIIEIIKKYQGIVKSSYSIIESDMAFDHSAAVLLGLLRLRNKLDWTDIIFNLMDDTFTLTELQRVYEGIKNTKETKANFRRKFIKRVIPTDIVKPGTGFRPPTLYRYNLTDF